MPQLWEELYAAGHKPFDLQIERLVALLRAAITSFCLIAFTTTPGRPIPDTPTIELILVVYTIFGLNVVLLPMVGRIRTGWQLPVHLIDIGVISILMYFLNSYSIPFFILYVFVLLSATVRWNWRGVLWTTLLLLALQVVLFVAIGAVAQFVIQYAFLTVIGGMFAFFGASRERSSERFTQLAAWPSTKTTTMTDIGKHWLDVSLAHIATVLRVPRVLVIWEVAQEPYFFTALFADGKCVQNRNPTNAFGNLMAAEIADATFACDDVRSKEYFNSEGTKVCMDPILNDSFQRTFQISNVCSAPFAGEICKGRVFMLDRADWGEDDLTLANVVASRLRIELEHYTLFIQLGETAAERERARLARDLHDGVLQGLTAAGLQLKTIASRSDQNLHQSIENVRKLLMGEQQRVRAFVDRREPSIPQQSSNLHIEMHRGIEEIERQWGCKVLLSVTPSDATVSPELTRQLGLILAEAAANAVQHGNASRVHIGIELTTDGVMLRVADNGQGLKGKTGSYNQTELAALGIGPRSIRKRITELRGTLHLSSSSQGVELCITLPCDDLAAHQTNDKANDYC